jgi:putative sterol carrier protein
MSTHEIFDQIGQRLADKDRTQLQDWRGVYQINLTGDPSYQYTIVVDAEGARVRAGSDPSPGVTLQMAVNDFHALVEGQLSPMAAFMSGKLTVSGDIGLALKLQNLLQ